MNIFIKNKKILALALCLSITAGQANAISWNSVGNSIFTFLKDSTKNITIPTPSSSSHFQTLIKWSVIVSIINIVIKKYYYNIYDGKNCNAKKILFNDLYDKGLLLSAIYASSPKKANLKYICIPATILLVSNIIGNISRVITFDADKFFKFSYAQKIKLNNFSSFLETPLHRTASKIIDGIDSLTDKISKKLKSKK